MSLLLLANVAAPLFDPASHRFLVASNWLRTACWSLRWLLVHLMVSEAAG